MSDLTNVVFHVCHKCGLVRWTEPELNIEKLGIPFLARCKCIGQTVYSYEEKARTLDEAISIAKKRFWEFVELFVRQKREAWKFIELFEEYNVDEKTKQKVLKMIEVKE